MESRSVRMMFQKGGSGSISTRLALPKSWIDEMGITITERSVTITFDGEKIEVRRMKKFISFYELGGWMRNDEMDEILLFDENGEKHQDDRFIGFTREGFGYNDPSTGELLTINLYDANGNQIDYIWAKEECEIDYYFKNPNQLKGE